jgi:hypothetical protein
VTTRASRTNAVNEAISRARGIAAREVLVMPYNGLNPGMQIEFVQQVLDVHFDSTDADVELAGNFFVA